MTFDFQDFKEREKNFTPEEKAVQEKARRLVAELNDTRKGYEDAAFLLYHAAELTDEAASAALKVQFYPDKEEANFSRASKIMEEAETFEEIAANRLADVFNPCECVVFAREED